MSTIDEEVGFATLRSASLPQLGMDADMVRDLYWEMARARELDGQAIALQRQGYFAAYAPFIGHEAVQIGSVRALARATDFVFPTYRELAAACAWGVDPVEYLSQGRGFAHGGAWDHAALRFGPLASVVAGPVLHAVGWAMGRQLDGAHAVALSFFGDGASSQGDVHEALNFAAVFAAPVVFVCINNGWAISVPSAEQVAGGSVAARAAGYGMEGVTVDGTDLFAVFAAVSAAAARARAGGGPTLIEARIWRQGPHSTSDDPGRYRAELTDDAWREQDPLARLRRWLRRESIVDDAGLADIGARATSWARQVAADVRALQPPPVSDVFRFAYRNPTSTVIAQEKSWEAAADND